jgi:hypothetical protein
MNLKNTNKLKFNFNEFLVKKYLKLNFIYINNIFINNINQNNIKLYILIRFNIFKNIFKKINDYLIFKLFKNILKYIYKKKYITLIYNKLNYYLYIKRFKKNYKGLHNLILKQKLIKYNKLKKQLVFNTRYMLKKGLLSNNFFTNQLMNINDNNNNIKINYISKLELKFKNKLNKSSYLLYFFIKKYYIFYKKILIIDKKNKFKNKLNKNLFNLFLNFKIYLLHFNKINLKLLIFYFLNIFYRIRKFRIKKGLNRYLSFNLKFFKFFKYLKVFRKCLVLEYSKKLKVLKFFFKKKLSIKKDKVLIEKLKNIQRSKDYYIYIQYYVKQLLNKCEPLTFFKILKIHLTFIKNLGLKFNLNLNNKKYFVKNIIKLDNLQIFYKLNKKIRKFKKIF